jgi:hypothetical protein
MNIYGFVDTIYGIALAWCTRDTLPTHTDIFPDRTQVHVH